MVHLYSTDERIHRFSIGYMVNSSLHVNKLFIEQVEIILNATFHERTMVPIIYVMKKKNTYIIALIIFYENKVTKQKKVYRVLNCVIYSLMDNYILIDYL